MGVKRMLRWAAWGTLLAAPAAWAQRPDTAQASTLQPGVWNGWLRWADDDSLRAQFLVEVKGKDIWITMRSRNNPDFGMGDIRLKDEVLTFNWALGAGTTLQCRLSRRGGPGFDGLCTDGAIGSHEKPLRVLINMRPPGGTPLVQ